MLAVRVAPAQLGPRGSDLSGRGTTRGRDFAHTSRGFAGRIRDTHCRARGTRRSRDFRARDRNRRATTGRLRDASAHRAARWLLDGGRTARALARAARRGRRADHRFRPLFPRDHTGGRRCLDDLDGLPTRAVPHHPASRVQRLAQLRLGGGGRRWTHVRNRAHVYGHRCRATTTSPALGTWRATHLAAPEPGLERRRRWPVVDPARLGRNLAGPHPRRGAAPTAPVLAPIAADSPY
jgi:hypothetical protein